MEGKLEAKKREKIRNKKALLSDRALTTLIYGRSNARRRQKTKPLVTSDKRDSSKFSIDGDKYRWGQI